MNDDNEFVYRIFKKKEFKNFKKNQIFQGNRLDKNSGFIHMSKKNQIEETLNKYFKEDREVYIVEFKALDLGDLLKWERSRNDDFFPHYYGVLKSQLIVKILQRSHL